VAATGAVKTKNRVRQLCLQVFNNMKRFLSAAMQNRVLQTFE
jgi:hypothetical protein